MTNGGNPCHDDKGKFCSEGGSPNVERTSDTRADQPATTNQVSITGKLLGPATTPEARDQRLREAKERIEKLQREVKGMSDRAHRTRTGGAIASTREKIKTLREGIKSGEIYNWHGLLNPPPRR